MTAVAKLNGMPVPQANYPRRMLRILVIPGHALGLHLPHILPSHTYFIGLIVHACSAGSLSYSIPIPQASYPRRMLRIPLIPATLWACISRYSPHAYFIGSLFQYRCIHISILTPTSTRSIPPKPPKPSKPSKPYLILQLLHKDSGR